MKVYRIDYKPADFRALPEKHRKLLLFLCAGISELNVLSKIFRFVPSLSPVEHHDRVASRAQGMVIGQIYTGKIFEFWKTFQVLYFASQLSSEYASKLSPDTRKSLKELKRYFGKKNLIEKIRNNYAFHHSPDNVEQALTSFPAEQDLSFYLADSLANSLFEFAELPYSYTVMESISPGDPKQAYSVLVAETAEVTYHLNQLVAELIAILIKEHIPASLQDLPSKAVNIAAVQESEVPSLPFFINYDDE